MVVREFGAPEVMRLEEVPAPVPGPGEVLIRVKAVSVNRTLDLVVRSGKYPAPVKLPHVLGVDPSGVVEAVAPDVTERKAGDRVVTLLYLKAPTPSSPPAIIGLHGWGGYAEYVKVPAAFTRPIPQGVDFPTATVVAPCADCLQPAARQRAAQERRVDPGHGRGRRPGQRRHPGGEVFRRQRDRRCRRGLAGAGGARPRCRSRRQLPQA